MAVIYDDATKQARLDAVVTRLGADAILEIGTTDMTSTLATFTLDATAGTATNDVLTLATFPQTVAATDTGTAAEARIRTSTNEDRVTGLTVGTSGTDIILDDTAIVSGANVVLNSATITHG